MINGEVIEGALRGGARGAGGRPALHHRPAPAPVRAPAGAGHARAAPGRGARRPRPTWPGTPRSSRTPAWTSSATASWSRAASWRASSTTRSAPRSSRLAATIDADRAAVETAKALVRADEAAVENVRVQLSYTEIRAPIGGRTGNLLLNQGNVVKANDVGNPDGGDQPGAPDLRGLLGAGSAARGDQALPGGGRPAGGGAGGRPAGWRRARPAHLHEQHGGPEHRDDPAQGHVREQRERPLAGPVRQRGAHPDAAAGRGAWCRRRRCRAARRASTCSWSSRTRRWRRGRWCRARPTGATWSSRAGSPRGSAW